MNKTESNQLMIGSWVLVGGEPRSICCITTKKVGFKRGTNGHRDFFRFDQLSGIPLSEPLLKECVKYRDIDPKSPSEKVQSVHCYSDTVIAIRETDGALHYRRFAHLHELQAYLATAYRTTLEFDKEKWQAICREYRHATASDWLEAMNRFNQVAQMCP